MLLLGCKDFVVFVVRILRLSTCAIRMLAVLSVGYGWQSPFQGVDDLFEIIKYWCLVIFWFTMSNLIWELFCVSLQVRLKLHGQAVLTLNFLVCLMLFLEFCFLYWDDNSPIQFQFNFGLVCLILFLDEHSPIHLQIIFHFVANINSAF